MFTDSDLHFSIDSSKGWVPDSPGQQGTRVILFKLPATSAFRANINVTVHDLGGMTPSEFLTFSRLQIKQMSGHPKLDIDQPATQPAGAHAFEQRTHIVALVA